MKAVWNGATIAHSDDTVVVEGNHYFPIGFHVDEKYLQASDTHTHCPWKGQADYFSLVVDGETNADAAWTYPAPKAAAQNIAGRVAFWKGVQVVE